MTTFFIKLIVIVLCWGVGMARLFQYPVTKFSDSAIHKVSLFLLAVCLHVVLLVIRGSCKTIGGCKKLAETGEWVPDPCELETPGTSWHLTVAVIFAILSLPIGGIEIYSGPGILLPPNAKFVGIENVVHEDDWKLCYTSSKKSFWPRDFSCWENKRVLHFCGKPAELTVYFSGTMKPDALILDTEGKLVVKSAVTDLNAMGKYALDMVEERLREIEAGFTSVGYTEVLSDTAVFETGLASATEKLLLRKLQKAPLPRLVGLVYWGEVQTVSFVPPNMATMDALRREKASKSAEKPTT